jgi:SAM-dependent methyltransferase
VGLPDGPTAVEIASPDSFAVSLDSAMQAFRELRPGTQTLVSAEVNATRKELWVRVLQNGSSDRDRNGQVELSLVPSFDALRVVAELNGAGLHYWGGNNYFDVTLPYPHPERDDFLDVQHLSWDERYRVLLDGASWQSLRDMVFRFADLAAALAGRCLACGMATVLIPSVGICVHPWLFASHGLTVTATDSARTALATLAEPGSHPNLYSSAAYEQWDISTCASFAMIPHPDHFAGMPALEDDRERDLLRQRITFVIADWARLPAPTGTMDLVFATNALPRDSRAERAAVLQEWIRVLRPGGVVYVAQHHAGGDWGIETFFHEQGFVEIDFLGGDRPLDEARGSFQIRVTSG